jgi:hypothetical protein
MTNVVSMANIAGFPEADFAKLDLSKVEWWVSELREAEASIRRLRQRLTQLVEPEIGRPCDGCGETMTGRTDRRFCSSACRQRAYRSRNAS